MNKYQHRGGVQSLISTPFNLQLFANKLISLDRMRDFLGECKNVFYMESDLVNENEINSIVEDQLIPKPIDLLHYASNHIRDYQNITEIPRENLDYLNSGLVATNMASMFYDCNKLQSVPKLNIDTSKCTSMRDMFTNCYALTSLDLSNFNTSNVTNMNSMFYNCRALPSLDVSNFNTSNVTNMEYIFYCCQALTSSDLSNFDTSKVTSMNSMFYRCQALTTIDLSNWDTSKVTDMMFMFDNCQALEHIEGIIDMKSCTSYRNMFLNCSKLSGVKIKNLPDNFESETYLNSSQYEIVS